MGRADSYLRHEEPEQIVKKMKWRTRYGFYLVAMGSARRSGLSRALLGSTASEVIDILPCDVLIGGTPSGLDPFRCPGK